MLPFQAGHAAMFKCTWADGTVAFQAGPCQGGAKEQQVRMSLPFGHAETRSGAPKRSGSTSSGAPAIRDTRDAQSRAIAEREEAQRRDRCRSYGDSIDRQRVLLGAATESARQSAVREIGVQERKLKEDRC